jgi:hypothetical protein
MAYPEPSMTWPSIANSSAYINSTGNILNITNPGNISRIEVQLNPGSSSDTNYLSIIVPAVGAVTAGVLGAYFTYRYGIMKEMRKEARFKASVTALVSHELKTYKDLIADTLKASSTISDKYPNVRVIRDEAKLLKLKSRLKGLSKQYSQLTIEEKASVFSPGTVFKLESIYERFYPFDFKTLTIVGTELEGCFYFSDLDGLEQEIEKVLQSTDEHGKKFEC